ncbi:MAG: heparinase II/III family protein, partial [Clostridia bacterium]|nr:heparinase II/III family protein [Clostridia bacterium]
MMLINKRFIAVFTSISLICSLFTALNVSARNIVFCNLDFENSSSPMGGMVPYAKDNSISLAGTGDNHYVLVNKTGPSDCHMDYTIGINVTTLVAEAEFIFDNVSSTIDPFYFIGYTLEGSERSDLQILSVTSDMGLYMTASPSKKLCTLAYGTKYKIAVAVNIDSMMAEVYVNGTKLGEKAITDKNFQRVKIVRNWIKNDYGSSSFRMDNYHIYESAVPQASVPDTWESVFPDDGIKRVTASEVKEAFRTQNTEYPRLFAKTADFDAVKLSSDKAVWYKKISRMADSMLSSPVVEYKLADSYRLLEVSREVLKRMQAWGFMYRITKNDKYYTRAMQEIEAICGFADWHPEHMLDTAEMMTAAAIAYDWFYDRMTADERKLLESSILSKGLYPFQKAYYGRLETGGVAGPSMNFVMEGSNMNIVDNCSAIIAASAVFEADEELCSDIIEKSVRSLAYSLPEFAPDGSWAEGINYWIYATEYLARAIAALNNTFGDSFGVSEYKGLKKTAKWAISLDSYRGVNSFHDTWDGMHLDTFSLSGLGMIYNDDNVLNFRKLTVNQMDYMPTVYDVLWNSPKTSSVSVENENYTKKIESVSIRESYFNSDGTVNKDGMYFSTHGGMNNAYHSHLDAGAFVFDLNGERWAMDIMPEDYNKAYASGVHDFYRKRAEGHNTLVINPSAGGGQISDAASTVSDYCFTEKDAYAVYDMTPVYADNVNSYQRGFYAGDNRRSLTIRDELDLKSSSTVYWFMHTRADIDIAENGAVLTLNDKKLKLEFKSNCAAEISKMAAEPLPTSPNPENQSDNTGISKVAIKLTGSGSINIEVKLYAYDESVSGMMYTDMSSWKPKETPNAEKVCTFEDYAGEKNTLPDGWSQINVEKVDVYGKKGIYGKDSNDNAYEINPYYNTNPSSPAQWYQTRYTTNQEIAGNYIKISYEMALDNVNANRWLQLQFKDADGKTSDSAT